MYTPSTALPKGPSTGSLTRILRLSFLGALVAVAIPVAIATTYRLRAPHLQAASARENEDFLRRGPVVPNPEVRAVAAGSPRQAGGLASQTTLAYQLHGIDFGPYIDDQDPNSEPIISEEQLRSRMQIIANYTHWVRSFGCTHGLEKIGMVAHSLGLNAAVGAWLSDDLSANAQEIANLISAANAGQVDLAIIGSEVLLRNDLTESQLIAYMNQVRQQIPANIPVTTADVYGKLLEHPAIIANSDVVFPNYYPYWEGASVNIAIATLHRQHQQIVAASPGKSVIVSETGWPSAGNTICNAVPSPTNASFYFLNFVSWARANNVSYFYFDALDEAWKGNPNNGEGPQGAHWGVWDKDGVLKPGMQNVFDGQTMPDNWTSAGIPGGPGTPSIEFSSVPPYGSFNNLFGQVLHVNTDDYRVAVYIRVGSGWWNKPTFATPSTSIGLTGGWECDITTGGTDENANQIFAYLVPANFIPPEIRGGQTLPPTLDQNSVAKTEIARSSTSLNIQGRVTDGNNQDLSCVTISLTGSQTATTHTISNGDYSFINLQPGGNYTVTPSHPSYVFNPSSLTFSNLASNQTGNFVAAPSTSTITLSASPSAGGTVSGGGTFATGSSRTVTATANSGYTFANWTENGSVVSSSSSYTFTLNGNRNLVANFTTVNYTITVSASPSAGGTVSGGGTFAAGSSRTVSGTANSGYTLANWTENGSVVSSSASYTFTLNGNRNLVANFTTVNYTITVSASPSAGGTVSGGGAFAAGSSRTVSGTANSGYTFANWTENGSVVSSSSSYTFTLNSNRILVANFTTVSQGTCGSPYNLSAGQVFNGNTSGGQSSFGSYGCVGWNESGAERVHTITLTSSGTLTATLSNLGGVDLDVFILSSCSTANCLAFGNDWASVNLGAGTYYIVVDGYQGDVGSYTLTINGDTDGDGMPDSVEVLEGTNPLVKDNDVFNNARLFVMQQYRDFLGREGDPGGISFWTSHLNSGSLSRAQVIDSFFNSTEFQGTVSPVTRLYFAYFLRIPDYGGLLFWVNQYRNGASLDTISQFFAQSPEFIARYGSLNNADFVTLLYNNVLGRQPDPGGLAFWVGQLNSGAMTRGQVMLGFSESPEFKQSSFNKVYVTMIYVGMLRRAPDQGGFDFWVNQLNGGASGLNLIQGFLGAPEYHNRFLP